MCKCVLYYWQPGVNPTAVNKYINITITYTDMCILCNTMWGPRSPTSMAAVHLFLFLGLAWWRLLTVAKTCSWFVWIIELVVTGKKNWIFNQKYFYDGDSRFLHNVGRFIPVYTVSYLRKRFRGHRQKNVRSHTLYLHSTRGPRIGNEIACQYLGNVCQRACRRACSPVLKF